MALCVFKLKKILAYCLRSIYEFSLSVCLFVDQHRTESITSPDSKNFDCFPENSQVTKKVV